MVLFTSKYYYLRIKKLLYIQVTTVELHRRAGGSINVSDIEIDKDVSVPKDYIHIHLQKVLT
jgi:hypothetical protein